MPGDELRHLHWKATARTGQLMVREYVDPAQPWCVVVLDTRRDALDAEAFETAVEIVASLLWAAAEQDRPARLATTGGTVVDVRPGTSGLRAAADRLCVVAQDTTAALDLATVGARLGDGWFVHVGAAPAEAVAVHAARYAEAIAFDVSAGSSAVRRAAARRGPADDPGTRRGEGPAALERDGAPVTAAPRPPRESVQIGPRMSRSGSPSGAARVPVSRRDTVAGQAASWADREQAERDRAGRARGLGLLLATAAAGLSFAAVFDPVALLAPVLAVVAGVAAADQLTIGRRRLAAVRAPLGLVLGGAAGVAALLLPVGVPATGTALRVLAGGVLHGWLRTLESTLPAHPDLPLLPFVPALVLLAAVVGVEWLRRGVAPAATLLPSLAVVVVAQVFAAVGWLPAIGLAAVYGLGAAVALAGGKRLVDALGPALPLGLVAVLVGWILATVDPVGGPAWTLADRVAPATVAGGAVSPLAELAGRLDRPDEVVFTARADGPVARWPLVVLDGYDGTGFTSSARYRPLGAQLPLDPDLTVPVRTAAADVAVGGGFAGPWLPGQGAVRSVEGLRPAVDPATGSLLLPDGAAGARYRLGWYAPQPGPEQLVGAAVDPEAAVTEVTGALPAAVPAAATEALRGAPPSFTTALVLERWFRDNYRLAGGDQRPTGSGDVQIVDFLTDVEDRHERAVRGRLRPRGAVGRDPRPPRRRFPARARPGATACRSSATATRSRGRRWRWRARAGCRSTRRAAPAR